MLTLLLLAAALRFFFRHTPLMMFRRLLPAIFSCYFAIMPLP